MRQPAVIFAFGHPESVSTPSEHLKFVQFVPVACLYRTITITPRLQSDIIKAK